MFFDNGAHTKKRREALAEVSQELRKMVDENFQKNYQEMRQQVIDAGVKTEEVENFLRDLKHKLQLRAIKEFKKELRLIVIATAQQEAKISSTTGNELSVEKQYEHPSTDDHLAKKPRFDGGYQ